MCRETLDSTQYYWCFGGFGFVVVGCLWVGCGLFCGGFFIFIFFGLVCGVWCLVGGCLVFGWGMFWDGYKSYKVTFMGFFVLRNLET